MLGLAKIVRRPLQDYDSCSACNLCLLVCPVWRRSRDFGLTPLGRAKALQHGAVAADIAAAIQSCTLCAACEPVCPEEIALLEMTLELRRKLVQPGFAQDVQMKMKESASRPHPLQISGTAVLLPGQALREHPATLARTIGLLGDKGKIALGDDDGGDIALALESGVSIPTLRLERFLQPLRRLKRIVVADGLLLRHLLQWLPQSKITSVGEALSGVNAVRGALRASDLYVIEPRAYHADYQRLVKYYDALRSAAGCAFNLDLQRIAIPATARGLAQKLGHEAIDDTVQTNWILQGRNITRIVVESMEDSAAFEQVSACPVVHLADLADNGKFSE